VEIPVENLRDIRGVRLSLLSLLGFGVCRRLISRKGADFKRLKTTLAADLRGLLKDYLLDTFVEQDRFKMIQQYCSASQMV